VHTGSRRTTHAWYIQDSFKAACVCSARLRNLFMTCTCTLNAKSAANQRSQIFPNASSRKPSLQLCVCRCKNLHAASAFASAEWTNFRTRAEFTHVSVIVGKVSDIGFEISPFGVADTAKGITAVGDKSGSVHPDAFACTTTNKKSSPRGSARTFARGSPPQLCSSTSASSAVGRAFCWLFFLGMQGEIRPLHS
jgi:hypothetical protein